VTLGTQIASGGGSATQASFNPAISADGRFAFASDANGLVPVDNNSRRDVYVYDRLLNSVELVSQISPVGNPGNLPSDNPAISADGRYVVFETEATNIVSGGGTTNATNTEVLVRDRYLQVTRRVSGELT